jgi:hypothetical protein
MPLIDRLPPHHTIREFRAAAIVRYWEATRLVAAGDRLAGIYLSGYTAEMLLKAAYFRLTGKGPNDAIAMTDINNAKKYAITTLGLSWPGNLHDLTKWGELLIEDRRFRRVPYPSALARSLHARVQRIYVNWREQLRYRANKPYQGKVDNTVQSVFWLLGQYRYL